MSRVSKRNKIKSELQGLFAELERACLEELPEDVGQFCLQWLADRNGFHFERKATITCIQSTDSIDNKTFRPQTSRSPKATGNDLQRVADYNTEDSGDETDGFQSDCDSKDSGSGSVVIGRVETVASESEVGTASCALFSTAVISPEELERKTSLYQKDERMKSLFRAWDGDGSGRVDFVELVLALHKFEDVASAGIDIQVASDALVQFVESDTERELNLAEFTRVIIIFALNCFHDDFDNVADHMLAVATSTSEAAVLQAASGADVSEIQAADKEEQEFLRQTAKGIEQNVTDNILKIRVQRTPRSSSSLKDK
ncbi:hypothetical protein BWQ96_06171 [Gracilariopsis chorda]|uniref:EF-hand domain-containing protein n=1 Tax=Gracilariopsis chorda TaxID=448386 RepID=A0A2V3ISL0_9FLOR|nr:hypothetical protein BWQ96_06171 [Gracilariopsis chorda]|eukprot:PXF44090.1 hypothetical protein BWQ96_06171 [Gracilariopsis chorda]